MAPASSVPLPDASLPVAVEAGHQGPAPRRAKLQGPWCPFAPSVSAIMDPDPSGGHRCPDCGGPLTGPISGDVHCFRRCLDCGAEFELSDGRLAPG
jgi:hypothetical protein